ncbi:glycosyltransferase family 4 protein [Aquamicrobium sp. LC103]|uniref:glycosyltransferase family 4 protein n=1 Tax=Aquamicrobium sp. LC103 TaxID=1120658 RepID=UPI00063E854A|nr:glycosyltransferase family 4 protein [Aquamicrobium sp. LC103]TKT82413.1 glycosyltransferase family 4 protein [Aquamicrobium sp. LC103]
MHIWFVRDSEPLPIDAGDRRLLRGGMLCKALAERGHDVCWITSSFDHYGRRQRTRRNETHHVTDRYRIELLRAPGYKRNTSPLRVWHNRRFARAFLDFAERAETRPDVIVTDVPTPEAAAAAIGVARRWNIPTLLSVRDLWPDFFADFLPWLPKPGLRLAVAPLEEQVAFACRNATAIVGISPQYLEWGLAKGGRERSELDAVVPLGYALPPPPSATETQEELARLRAMGIDTDKRIVSFVGTWGSTYDIDLVIQTAALFKDRSDVQFVLAGDGDESGRMQRPIEGLANVVAPGWLNARQVAVLLERSAIGLMPYREGAPQGLPNKIFEYMAYGVYQISTLNGEASALLDELEAGLTVPGGNPQALAAAISQGLERSGLVGERERIRHEFLRRYGADAIYAELSERIERLNGGREG